MVVDLYHDEDMQNTKTKLRNRFITALVILAVVVAALVVLLWFRLRFVAIAATIVGIAILFFYCSMKLMPWYRYQRYLKDMNEGLRRVTQAWMVSISDSSRAQDGVMCRDFLVRVDESEEGERLFFWDEDKTFPAIAQGQMLTITSYGNFVLKLECQ